MRIKIAVSVTLLLSVSAVAVGQTQVQCRPLQPNDVLGSDGSIVDSGGNAVVCHAVVVAVQPATSPEAAVASPSTPPPAAAIGGSVGSKVSEPVEFYVGYEYDS